MIKNNFIINMTSKDLKENITKPLKEPTRMDNSFEKVLNKKIENQSNDKGEVKVDLDTKEVPLENTINKESNNTLEEKIEKLSEIVNCEDDFQGNNLETEVLEEIVAILNHIMNTPEFENIKPIKLEDPMFIESNNQGIEIVETLHKEAIPVINKNEVLEDINLSSNMNLVENENVAKEAINLSNVILETLNSKNINEVLSSSEIENLKSTLSTMESLINNIFEKPNEVITPEIIKLIGATYKDVITLINEKVVIEDTNANLNVNLEKTENVFKEAINLSNMILETLNSKNINEVLSSSEVEKLKSTLEILTNNIFKKVSEVVNSDVVKGFKVEREIIKDNIEVKSEFNTLELNSKESLINNIIEKSNEVITPEIIGLIKETYKDVMTLTNEKIVIEDTNANLNVNLEKTENVFKEAINLSNGILETLNSKNINEVLSSSEVENLKSTLETLTNNLFEKVNEVISPEVDKVSKVELKALNEISETRNEISTKETGNDEIKTIIDKLKVTSNNDGEKIKSTDVITKPEVAFEEVSKEVSEEEKVLSKILGESESGVLNRPNNLVNRLNINSQPAIKEPMVVHKETVNTDIIKNVKFMINNAVSELKVKVYPKELGEMTIKIPSEEGILKADIRATSKETYNLLHSNFNEIKKSLEQQNIKIHEVNIGLYSEDTTYHSNENEQQQKFNNNESNKGNNSSSGSRLLNEEIEQEVVKNDNSVDLLV